MKVPVQVLVQFLSGDAKYLPYTYKPYPLIIITVKKIYTYI